MNITEALDEQFWEKAELLTIPEGRRELTKYDPLLFAYVYFPHHLKAPDGSMTVSEFHLDLLEHAKHWAHPTPVRKQARACFIAPRSSGKSTWIFLLLPMWAAAHGHRKFIAAFSDSASQAEDHLYSFKQELETNELLQKDFPELCAVHKSTVNARAMMDNRNQTRRANDFIFMARGADASSLGMKVGEKRPDVLLFDDIEPGESNYSEAEARRRKETLLSDLLPLNDWAVVAIVGTTTMPNSLIDQMRKVKSAEEVYSGDPNLFRESLEPDLRWVVDEQIKVHYWPAILSRPAEDPSEGEEEVSVWPEKWSMEDLNRDRHTRAFAKNFMNKPVSLDGGYWDEEDIDIDQPLFFKKTLLSIDPAVTTARRSDYTGLAVISIGNDGLAYVRHAEQVKLPSNVLADKVKSLVERYKVGIALVETNQGGDLWRQVFKDLPCKFQTIRQRDKKEVRASQVADFYKRGQVKHTEHFHIAEEQMLAFPHVTHDDVVDAICTGVLAFKKYARGGIKVTQTNYLEGK